METRVNPARTTTALWALVAVSIGLLLARLWLDARLELMFDEAYYTLWSRNLAFGYFDHPPMVALWIRLSTFLFGQSDFGVRALGTLATSMGTLLVYFVSLRLFHKSEQAVFAALLYGAMLLISAGAIIMTPDTPLVFFWSIALYGLVRIFDGGRSAWWLVVGVAMGLALQSKYTALLLGAGIVVAMAVVPRLRPWWRHPMPYLGGLLAFSIFAPVVVWNAQHEWSSFAFQFGRVEAGGLSLRYVGEFVGSQVGLLTPFAFVLAVAGIVLGLRSPTTEEGEARRLLVASIAPLIGYFIVHSLHARVQGNWVAPAYPILAVLGAEAASSVSELPARLQGVVAFSRRHAVPVGLAFTLIVYAQAATGIIPINPAKDPSGTFVGWGALADKVNAIADRADARYVLTSHYILTSELTVYSHSQRPVVQYNERIRWVSFPPPPSDVFDGNGLYVVEASKDRSDELAARFATFKRIGEIDRSRHGQPVMTYVVYLVSGVTRTVVDQRTATSPQSY